MQWKAQKRDLLEDLQLVQGIVETRTTIPILANLLLKAAKDHVDLVSTDLQVGLRTRFPAKVKKGGETTVSAKKLFEIVRALPDVEVDFRQEDPGSVEIRCEGSRFKLQTLAPDDYPAVPEPEMSGAVRFPLPALQEMIERVLFAVTREDNRFAMNGALLKLQPEGMTLVATDGHRLALVRKSQILADVKDGREAIIPKKALQELLRIRGAAQEEKAQGKGDGKGEGKAEAPAEVAFTSDENHLYFRTGPRMLMSRTLEGSFPNFERVLPHDNRLSLKAPREKLLEAVRRVLLLAQEKSPAARLSLAPGQLRVLSSTPEVGEAEETLAVTYDGPEMEIVFNGEYLTEWLTRVGTADVEVTLKDTDTQGLFVPVGAYEYDYRYVIMPMRL